MIETAGSMSKSCLICSTPITIPHYGIDACRSCAEFYKRAKVAGKRFVCRQGDFKCVIMKDSKFTCRRCRFDRCVENGMNYEMRVKETEEELTVLKQSPSTSSEPAESILQRIGRLYNASMDRRRNQELQLLQYQPDIEQAPHPSQEIYMSTYSNSIRLFEITF
ncbi:hypothetical protein PFISCL1PPCAC_13693, partial [Pristionchus fissidentatus]